jgi:hypothetical protein
VKATATFTLDSFDQQPPYSAVESVEFAKATVKKTFTGELHGTSELEMLTCRGPNEGAAYVAIERISATLEGRTGTFALLHAGTREGEDKFKVWQIVPHSGTHELVGIRGEGRIDVAPDGTHTFELQYAWS